MHEASLVRTLLKQVAVLATVHRATSVEAVRVQIGPLAGVEPLLFQEAFVRLAPGTTAASAALQIDLVPVVAQCQDCEVHFTSMELRFDCPSCGSRRIKITAGDAVMLESLTLEINDAGESSLLVAASQAN